MCLLVVLGSTSLELKKNFNCENLYNKKSCIRLLNQIGKSMAVLFTILPLEGYFGKLENNHLPHIYVLVRFQFIHSHYFIHSYPLPHSCLSSLESGSSSSLVCFSDWSRKRLVFYLWFPCMFMFCEAFVVSMCLLFFWVIFFLYWILDVDFFK